MINLGPSYSDNKSDIFSVLKYIFMHYSNVCLYAKAELNPSRNEAVILKKQKIGSSDPILPHQLNCVAPQLGCAMDVKSAMMA